MPSPYHSYIVNNLYIDIYDILVPVHKQSMVFQMLQGKLFPWVKAPTSQISDVPIDKVGLLRAETPSTETELSISSNGAKVRTAMASTFR